jgi:hypothetical protein
LRAKLRHIPRRILGHKAKIVWGYANQVFWSSLAGVGEHDIIWTVARLGHKAIIVWRYANQVFWGSLAGMGEHDIIGTEARLGLYDFRNLFLVFG